MISAEELLELTGKRGIREAEVYQVRSHSRPVSFAANRLKQLETLESEGVSLRLWRNGCPGLAVAYGEFNPDDLIDKALAISALNPAEEIELNGANKLIYPLSNSTVNISELIEQGKQVIAVIRDRYPEVISNVDLEWETETTTLVNSSGLCCQHNENSYGASIGVEWVKGDDFLEVYDGEYSHKSLDLTKAVSRILDKLQWAAQNVEVNSGKVPVLFTPNAVNILWETVSEALNGKRVWEKSSPWTNSIAQQVTSSCLSLTQQPDWAPYNCPFDDEGTPTQQLNLIESGNLTSFYCDRQTAKKLRINNTGNGFRPSLGSYPTPDLVNLIVNSGDKSWQELVKSLDYGIIIAQILGDDPDISGDFSVNIDLGYLVRQGEIQGRVKDTMLAGNVYHALKQVKELGNDRIWSSSCYSPSIIIDNLSVVN